MSTPQNKAGMDLARKIRDFREALTPQERALWDTGTRFLEENPGFTLYTDKHRLSGDYAQDD